MVTLQGYLALSVLVRGMAHESLKLVKANIKLKTKDFSFTTLYLFNKHVIKECGLILHSLYKDVNDT